MNKKKYSWLTCRLLPGLLATLFTVSTQAGTLELTSDLQCSEGNAINGVTVDDVTGNLGGSDDCWGTFDGNNSTYDSLVLDGMDFFEISKFDLTDEAAGDGDITGDDIGLVVGFNSDGSDLDLTSGTWSYDPTLFSVDTFFISLKAANNPGFAVWLFGDSSDSYSGTWKIDWTTPGGSNPDLSHLSIYAKQVSEPNSLALFILGLLFIFSIRRPAWMKIPAKRQKYPVM